MLEPCPATSRPQDRDDVDAQGETAREFVVVVAPESGQSSQAALLGPRHGLERCAVGLARAGLDLADDELAAVDGDDVDLAPHAAPVAVEDRQALAEQVAAREPFAVVAEGAGGEVHGDHPPGADPVRTPVSARLWTAYAIGEGVWTNPGLS